MVECRLNICLSKHQCRQVMREYVCVCVCLCVCVCVRVCVCVCVSARDAVSQQKAWGKNRTLDFSCLNFSSLVATVTMANSLGFSPLYVLAIMLSNQNR